jgi:hypothetical protein
MCTSDRSRLPVVVALLAAAACGGSEAPPELAASASSIEPPCATGQAPAPVTVRGVLPVSPSVSFSDGVRDVDTRYRAWIGDAELTQVVWVDTATLTASVPAGLPAGVYPLTLQSPFDVMSTLANAFEVRASCSAGTAAIAVTPTTGLVTTERGGSATFTVVLGSQPTADVRVALSSSDATEGTVSPASLTFTPANWNAPQTVTVTGVNDADIDGPQAYGVVTAPATSDDPAFAGIDPPDVVVTNTDDDSAGVTVTPTSGLVTTESGGTATFRVELNTRPTANVTIALATSDATEGTIAPASLVFTRDNWNAPQTVTVTGVNDDAADGPQAYAILTAAAASGDARYAGIDPPDVAASNTDNDTAGFTIAPPTATNPATPITTTEAGGTATFTVVLNTQPTASVSINVASTAPDEGTVGPATLTFTTANWNAPQTVTVTGVDDLVADGSQQYAVSLAPATSADPRYAGLDPANVAVSNTDNDSPGFTVSAISGPTTEAGGSATFSVVLNSQPTAPVTVAVSTASDEGTVSPATLTFTTANWNQAAAHVVTVTGRNDDVADGNQPYTVVLAPATSADGGYAGLDPADVSVSNVDNDSAGFTISPASAAVPASAPLTTTEAGGTATFSVVLNSQPTATVTVAVSTASDEGTVSPATLTFTAANWNQAAAHVVTVTGQNDLVADGNQPYTVVLAPAASADGGYAGLDPADVAVSNTDNDSPGFTVSAISGPTTEAGGSATFTVVLTSQPTATVTVAVTSLDLTEGTVGPATLTFTAADWNLPGPHTVTVTGVNDAIDDGNVQYAVDLGPAGGGDPVYAGLDPGAVAVTNTDDDVAGITLTPPTTLTTNEAGGSATFTVVLTSQPTAPVTVALSSSDLTEGIVSTNLTFTAGLAGTPGAWNVPQTVTVTGQNDVVVDGNVPYTITVAPQSGDGLYAALLPANLTFTNADNETPSVIVSQTTLTTTEAGGQATFTIVLGAQPASDVVIGLSSTDTGEGTVSPASLTFTPGNWNDAAAHTVTVTGANDVFADGPQQYGIVTAPATGPGGYAGFNAADLVVTNNDDEVAGFTVTPEALQFTSEDDNPNNPNHGVTYTVTLSARPVGAVTVTAVLPPAALGEGTVIGSPVVFTTDDFGPKTVRIVGEPDGAIDGDQTYSVSFAPSGDAAFAALPPVGRAITNLDNGRLF